ncbi:MAG: O-antigen ligase family protein [bacterium]|nr:O-antigen ligase family protein [bacterium]
MSPAREEGRLSGGAAWFATAGVSLLLVLVPLAWWPGDVYGLVKWVLAGILATLAAAVWLAASLADGSFRLRRSAINAPLALLFLWSLASLLSGTHPYHAGRRLHEISLFVLVFLVVSSTADGARRRAALAAAACAGLAAVSALGVAHYAGLFPVESPWGAGLGRRVYATMLNPNFLADFIICLFPLALALFSMRAIGRLAAAPLALVLALSFLCLLFTVSWGGWAGWLVAALLFLRLAAGRCRAHLRPGRAAAALGLCAAAAAAFLWLHRATVAADDTGMRTRYLYWRACVRMIRERPIAGHGLNAFAPEAPARLARIAASDFPAGVPAGAVAVYEGNFAHNEYLGVWVELGVVGLLLAAWLAAAVFSQGARNLAAGGGPLEAAIDAGGACGIAALLVQSTVSYPFRVPASAVAAAVLMGLIGSGAAAGRARVALDGIPAAARAALAAALIAAWASLVPRLAAPLAGETRYVEARRASALGDWEAARRLCLEAAAFPVTEPEFYDLLGEANERLGLSAAAAEAYARKLELKPHDVHANVRLGILSAGAGREDLAAAHFTAAIGMERRDEAPGRVRLAELMERGGRPLEARALLEAGLPGRGGDWMLRNSIGVAAAAAGDYSRALGEFTAAAASGGETPRHNRRVLLAHMAGSAPGPPGRGSFIGPSEHDLVEARIGRARAALRAGDAGRARAELDELLDRFPGHGVAAALRAAAGGMTP